jgi:hypothetical protein
MWFSSCDLRRRVVDRLESVCADKREYAVVTIIGGNQSPIGAAAFATPPNAHTLASVQMQQLASGAMSSSSYFGDQSLVSSPSPTSQHGHMLAANRDSISPPAAQQHMDMPSFSPHHTIHHRLSQPMQGIISSYPFPADASPDQTGFGSLLMDHSLPGSGGQSPNASVNPADLMSHMSPSPSPFHRDFSGADITTAMDRAPSPHSQVASQMPFLASQHSPRNSLDPSSAAFPHGPPPDWTMLQGPAFQGHRRSPSEHSDMSSVAPSPYLPNLDGSFGAGEPQQPQQQQSPLLNSQSDFFAQDGLGIEHFTISDNPQQQNHRLSPGPSPGVSPRLSPHLGEQQLGVIFNGTNFVLPQDVGAAAAAAAAGAGAGTLQLDVRPGAKQERIPSLQLNSGAGELGSAAQMATPEINIEYAAPLKQQNLEPPQTVDDNNALSPPERGEFCFALLRFGALFPTLPSFSSRGEKHQLTEGTRLVGRKSRIRAKSDPYVGVSRSPSPRSTLPFDSRRSLSPHDITGGPPSSSGSDNNGGTGLLGSNVTDGGLAVPAAPGSPASLSPQKSSRRSSTSSIPNREYILELADPHRLSAGGGFGGGAGGGAGSPVGSPGGSPGGSSGLGGSVPGGEPSSASSASKRMQKHPATFQCTLCPKRFTRAYNLRSHLRTHTDERPFVCTVCGKAFARQHDRKRHEGLHSGEKKFVCRGELKLASSNGNGSNSSSNGSSNKNDGGCSTTTTTTWGCGRRFARADALGRHFRSEAGRICIKPLLEEEAAQRRQITGAAAAATAAAAAGGGDAQQLQHYCHPHSPHNPHPHPHFPQQPFFPLPSSPGGGDGGMLSSSDGLAMSDIGGGDGSAGGVFTLPQAVLAQYPDLAHIAWDSIGGGGPGGEDPLSADMSARSSFDASSFDAGSCVGELSDAFDDETDAAGGYMSGCGDDSGFGGGGSPGSVVGGGGSDGGGGGPDYMNQTHHHPHQHHRHHHHHHHHHHNHHQRQHAANGAHDQPSPQHQQQAQPPPPNLERWGSSDGWDMNDDI